MFLIAVTQHDIANLFSAHEAQVVKNASCIITSVTDNFLSRRIQTPEAFSILESPLCNTPSLNETAHVKIDCDQKMGRLAIQKPSSGRPVYYTLNGRGEFFCSSHISFLRTAGVRIEENVSALPEFFVYGHVMPPRTLYKNIQHLPLGTALHVKINNGHCSLSEERHGLPTSFSGGEQNIQRFSSQAVRILKKGLQAAAPQKNRIAALLSGGMDSSILFKLCQDLFGVHATFSTGYPFEDPERNKEKHYALSAADMMGSEHQYYEATTREYLFGMLEGIHAAEEPLYHLQSVLLYLLFKNGLPQHGELILSGEGADASFGTLGHRFLFEHDKAGFKLLATQPFLKSMKALSRMTGKGQRFIDLFERLHGQYFPASDEHSILWSKGAWGSFEWTRRYFNIKTWDIVQYRYRALKPYETCSLYDLYTLSDFHGGVTMTETIWSKLGERCGKKHLYPFTDMEMLNHAFSIPWSVKLKVPKRILRAVAGQLKVPDLIINRKKRDFGITPERWSAKGGVFEPLIPLASKAFDAEELRRMQYMPDDMRSFSRRKARTLWNGLNYALWKRLCIHNESSEHLSGELSESLAKQKGDS